MEKRCGRITNSSGLECMVGGSSTFNNSDDQYADMGLVILYGPRSTGKSTIGRLLAKKLGSEYVDLDAVSNQALIEQGYAGVDGFITKKKEEFVDDGSIHHETHAWQQYARWQREVFKDVVEKYANTNTVLDVGGSTLCEATDGENVNAATLAAYPSTNICLRPDHNYEKAIELLFSREKERPHWIKKASNDPAWGDEQLLEKTRDDYMARLESDSAIADAEVYVNGRSPEEVSAEIIGLLENQK